MRAVKIEVVPVQKCVAIACAYNTRGACHAKAITIGSQITPNCDTFLFAKSHARNENIHAYVGACKVSRCKYNQDFECTAASIRVGVAGRHAQCLTYQTR